MIRKEPPSLITLILSPTKISSTLLNAFRQKKRNTDKRTMVHELSLIQVYLFDDNSLWNITVSCTMVNYSLLLFCCEIILSKVDHVFKGHGKRVIDGGCSLTKTIIKEKDCLKVHVCTLESRWGIGDRKLFWTWNFVKRSQNYIELQLGWFWRLLTVFSVF